MRENVTVTSRKEKNVDTERKGRRVTKENMKTTNTPRSDDDFEDVPMILPKMAQGGKFEQKPIDKWDRKEMGTIYGGEEKKLTGNEEYVGGALSGQAENIMAQKMSDYFKRVEEQDPLLDTVKKMIFKRLWEHKNDWKNWI